ncbi:MAG: SdiA-regulated domain-containing protein [Flavobacteriaceae bacterium]|nr:SdiA-regulated domain-containing protein [Flavobacteriaceae bacterium]
MKKIITFLVLFILYSCTNYGQLQLKADLPKILEEVSGIQYDKSRDAFWMINDSGNKPSVYLVSEKGVILRELKIKTRNTDWEDITMDAEGNLYVGDFGNNANDRKNLHILKIKKEDLESDEIIEVEKIYFSFPEQKKFPPKKKKRYYDVEAFFAWKGSFYLFTKSRVPNEIGRTFLYRVTNIQDYIPAKTYGTFEAELISDFTTCPEKNCWITSADISKDGKKVVLLNHKSAWVFTNFTGDNFFSGNHKEYPFGHESQKESITFKNPTTVYVADEENGMSGRNLYLFRLD